MALLLWPLCKPINSFDVKSLGGQKGQIIRRQQELNSVSSGQDYIGKWRPPNWILGIAQRDRKSSIKILASAEKDFFHAFYQYSSKNQNTAGSLTSEGYSIPKSQDLMSLSGFSSRLLTLKPSLFCKPFYIFTIYPHTWITIKHTKYTAKFLIRQYQMNMRA